MKIKLFELFAFLILIFGIIAIIFLAASMAVDLISPGKFLLGVVLIGVILYRDSLWIDKHFVDGEWV